MPKANIQRLSAYLASSNLSTACNEDKRLFVLVIDEKRPQKVHLLFIFNQNVSLKFKLPIFSVQVNKRLLPAVARPESRDLRALERRQKRALLPRRAPNLQLCAFVLRKKEAFDDLVANIRV